MIRSPTTRSLFTALAAALLISGSFGAAAHATQVPAPSAGDPRIRVVAWVPDEVVRVDATLGYAITVEFGPGEKIETVSIGDSLGWQVTPNRRANLLFVKPIDKAAPTNMTVVTNARAYTFELRARTRPRGDRSGDDSGVIYAVKFEVPTPALAFVEAPPPPPPPPPPQDVNHAYSYSGSRVGLPTRVFDDGVSTYFAFADTTDYPAIFAVDPDNKEAAVNVSQREGLVAVDRLAKAFVLRRGAEITRVVNDGFHADTAQPTALTRHKGK